MLEALTKIIPKYNSDKITYKCEAQIKNLPDHLRIAIIHGTQDECWNALQEIWEMERVKGIEILGDSANELIREKRNWAQRNNKV